jgi:uncharacterized Zn finger protein (UPF0148 family)
MSNDKCPNCNEWWVYGPRGEDVCPECGMDKPNSKTDEPDSSPR